MLYGRVHLACYSKLRKTAERKREDWKAEGEGEGEREGKQISWLARFDSAFRNPEKVQGVSNRFQNRLKRIPEKIPAFVFQQ